MGVRRSPAASGDRQQVQVASLGHLPPGAGAEQDDLSGSHPLDDDPDGGLQPPRIGASARRLRPFARPLSSRPRRPSPVASSIDPASLTTRPASATPVPAGRTPFRILKSRRARRTPGAQCRRRPAGLPDAPSQPVADESRRAARAPLLLTLLQQRTPGSFRERGRRRFGPFGGHPAAHCRRSGHPCQPRRPADPGAGAAEKRSPSG